MDNYKALFTTFESTDPPPVQTQDYKIVLSNYDELESSKFDSSWIIPINLDLDFLFLDDLISEFPEIKQELQTAQPLLLSSIVLNVLTLAASLLGNKYTWGGTKPETGMDCSGLIYWAYKLSGIKIPRDTAAMLKSGKNVSISDVKPGDIIITGSRGPSGRHARLVTSVDDNGIHVIEAKGKKYGIVKTDFKEYGKVLAVKRYWDQTTIPLQQIASVFPLKKSTKSVTLTTSYTGYNAFLNNMLRYEQETGDMMSNQKRNFLIKAACLESGFNAKSPELLKYKSTACGYFGMTRRGRKDLGTTQQYLNNTNLQFKAASRLYDANLKYARPYWNKAKALGLSDNLIMYGFWFWPEKMIKYINNGGRDDGSKDGQGSSIESALRKMGNLT